MSSASTCVNDLRLTPLNTEFPNLFQYPWQERYEERVRRQCTSKFTWALGLYVNYHGNQEKNCLNNGKIKHRSISQGMWVCLFHSLFYKWRFSALQTWFYCKPYSLLSTADLYFICSVLSYKSIPFFFKESKGLCIFHNLLNLCLFSFRLMSVLLMINWFITEKIWVNSKLSHQSFLSMSYNQ